MFKLDNRLLSWMTNNNWSLRPLQSETLKQFCAEKDMLIMAGTASGKTEAAFLPVLSALAAKESGTVLAIFPLTALINDQYQRLADFCEMLGFSVVPWHGEASATKRKLANACSHSVVLITPESLEGAIRRAERCPEQFPFNPVTHVVIDEFHSLIGTSRGHQVRSLLSRLELLQEGFEIPRIALSATIGDVAAAIAFLRSNLASPPVVITQPSNSTATINLTYFQECTEPCHQEPGHVCAVLSEALLTVTKGQKSLIFPNAKREIERLAKNLTDQSIAKNEPLDVFVHHASVSASLRREAESSLRGARPTAVLCSSTLEMGIDLPNVGAVVQLESAPSVSALRQRMGRAGRESASPVLHGLSIGPAIQGGSGVLHTRMAWDFLNLLAQGSLALQGWAEPEDFKKARLTTLVHQIMSLFASFPYPLSIEVLEMRLTMPGNAFHGVTRDMLSNMLDYLVATAWLEYLEEEDSWRFTAKSGELFSKPGSLLTFSPAPAIRVYCNGSFIGEVSPRGAPAVGSHILLGGRGWVVLQIEQKPGGCKIEVAPAGKGGVTSFGGPGNFEVSFEQAKRVCDLLLQKYDGPLPSLCPQAEIALNTARATYRGLSGRAILPIPWQGSELVLMAGTRVHRSVCLAAKAFGLEPEMTGSGVLLKGLSAQKPSSLLKNLRKILSEKSHHKLIKPSATNLYAWSYLLAPEQRKEEYIFGLLDDYRAREALQSLT